MNCSWFFFTIDTVRVGTKDDILVDSQVVLAVAGHSPGLYGTLQREKGPALSETAIRGALKCFNVHFVVDQIFGFPHSFLKY